MAGCFPSWCCVGEFIGGKNPISLLWSGQSFEMPAHSGLQVLAKMIPSQPETKDIIVLSFSRTRWSLSMKIHVIFSICLFYVYIPNIIWGHVLLVCLHEGMLMNKAVLFIAVEDLLMCTEAWVEIALTFSISLPLYCKDAHMQLWEFMDDIKK